MGTPMGNRSNQENIEKIQRSDQEKTRKQKAKGTPQIRGMPFRVGAYLFYRAVASQVSSARQSLTSVFGMGTGGPSA